jgi:DNA-binding beta-propeller fold protein YncE
MLYPQSPQSSIYAPTELKTFDRVGSLYYPQDAKFDYVRGFIWIADTGNNRVLKVDLNTKKVRITIKSVIYPYALTVDLNTGNIFIEYQSRGKLSGIATTQAEYWCYWLSDFHLILIETEELKKMCRIYLNTKRDVCGGDNNTSKGVLLPLTDFIKKLYI